MLYRTEIEKSRQILVEDEDSSGSDNDDKNSDIAESENMDKVSEMEDMALKDASAKQAGRIIRDEQDEIVKVELESYRKYFRFAGGCSVIVIFNLIMMTFVFVGFAANYYTQKWAYGTPEEQQDNYGFYAYMIFGLNVISAILIFFRANF